MPKNLVKIAKSISKVTSIFFFELGMEINIISAAVPQVLFDQMVSEPRNVTSMGQFFDRGLVHERIQTCQTNLKFFLLDISTIGKFIERQSLLT